ncbi:hypothetical protein APHAL10511_002248 [Amanita phalloides]|nr:hypothetical protein APHAL10511_002248 [Amanita phalloides]
MYSRHRAGPERRESEPRTYLVKTLMKRLNWLLRYGVGYKLVNTRPDGFVRVHDILTSRGLRGYDMASFQEIMKLDFLRRFELRWEFCGHLCAKELFVRLAKEEMKIPVEGVDRGNKKIARITNLPPVAQYTLTPDRWSDISHHGIPKAAGNLIHLHAIRNNPLEVDYSLSNCVILVDIDTHAAFYAGISFYIAKNKDLVTEGDPNGVLPPIYFKKAVKVAYECHQLV